jgi:hypothetical protein
VPKTMPITVTTSSTVAQRQAAASGATAIHAGDHR